MPCASSAHFGPCPILCRYSLCGACVHFVPVVVCMLLMLAGSPAWRKRAPRRRGRSCMRIRSPGNRSRRASSPCSSHLKDMGMGIRRAACRFTDAEERPRASSSRLCSSGPVENGRWRGRGRVGRLRAGREAGGARQEGERQLEARRATNSNVLPNRATSRKRTCVACAAQTRRRRSPHHWQTG